MNKLKIFSFLFFFTALHFSHAVPLTKNAKVSLITASPGEELYSTFGHSAIRVKDDVLGIDFVYNYGTFNFDTPNFYIKFIRGKLNYMLDVEQYDRFYLSYQYNKRSLKEQVLNLTQKESQAVFDYLSNNYKPENRYYKYDFFYDNCATRIRDVFQDVLGDKLEFDENYVDENVTFRNLIDQYLTELHWSDFGIDIDLGLPCDEKADWSEHMFLPDYLSMGFGAAKIKRGDQEQPFVKQTRSLLEIKGNDKDADPVFFTPVYVSLFVFLFALIITFIGYTRKKAYNLFDLIYFSILGLVGWQIVFLWFFTDHQTARDNLNILWAMPIYLPFIFLVYRRATRYKIKFNFSLIMLIINLLLIVLWPFNPQQFHIAFFGIIATSALRFGYRCYILKHQAAF